VTGDTTSTATNLEILYRSADLKANPANVATIYMPLNTVEKKLKNPEENYELRQSGYAAPVCPRVLVM
jgi:hypothetical protein